MYEVPENNWQDSETEQYHGFPSPAKQNVDPRLHPHAPNHATLKGNTYQRSRLPHVEPTGMYTSRSNSQQRTSTPDQSASKQASEMSSKLNGDHFRPDFLRKESYGSDTSDSARSILYNPKLNGGSSNTTNNLNKLSNKSDNNHQLQMKQLENIANNNSYQTDKSQRSLYTQPVLYQNGRPAESHETSFMNPHATPKAIKTTVKKAVQFADDVLPQQQVSNVKASNSSDGGSNQRQDRSKLDVRIAEKSRQNPTFFDDMDCLSYSVV